MNRKHSFRFAGLTSVALCSSVLSAAPIVYTPAEALANMGANPYTDANGGVWTVTHRNNPADETAAGNATLAPADMGDGRKGFRRNGDSFPAIAVNSLSTPLNVEGVNLAPGELFLHPDASGNPNDGKSRGALTFIVPRNGWYSIEAQFRVLNPNFGEGISYTADTTVAIDGTVMMQQDLIHGSMNVGVPVNLERRFLRKGAKISFVIGPGWRDTLTGWVPVGQWNHVNDGTGLAVKITEEESLDDAAVTAVASLGSTLYGKTAATLTTSEFDDDSGIGAWGVYASNWWSEFGFLDVFSKVPMNVITDNDEDLRGVKLEAVAESYPYVYVVGSENIMDTGMDAKQGWPYDHYAPYGYAAPKEIALHPGNYNEVGHFAVGMRFTAKEAGTYIATAKVRDASHTAGLAFDGAFGVYTWLYANGVEEEGHYVIAENSDISTTWVFMQTRPLVLSKGSTIDLIVHPGAHHYNDGTILTYDVVKLADTATGSWNAGAALAANAKKGADRTVSVEQNGATWISGCRDVVMGGAFQPFTTQKAMDGGVYGFYSPEVAEYGIIAGNTNEQTCRYGKDSQLLYADDFFVHTMDFTDHERFVSQRFVAPKDGVYSVRTLFRDIDRLPEGYAWYQTGVNCMLMANDGFLATGVANIDPTADSQQQAALNADSIYLKAGEPIDIMVGPRNFNGCDSTAVRASVSAEAAKNVVSVDFNTGSSATYQGRGRVGYLPAKGWSPLAVSSTASSVSVQNARDHFGNHTVVEVSLSAAAGQTLSVPIGAYGQGTDLMTDGLRAEGEQVFGWKVRGLAPGADYTLYLYGRGYATFTLGQETKCVDSIWSCNNLCGAEGVQYKDHTVLAATADANGEIAGTFQASEGGPGLFCGLQIEGSAFNLAPHGLTILVR